MPNVVFARSSIGRKKEFKVITTFERSNGKVQVIKRAAHTEGRDFLLELPYKTKALSENFKQNKSITVPMAKLSKESIVFEYLDGPTLDLEFSEALLQRDNDKLVDLFGEVLTCIDSLATSKSKPDMNLRELFGNDFEDSDIEMIDCGYIDFNLDNFVRGPNTLFLIDAEFKYPFGVPKQFVINRLLISYLSRYSHITSTLASEKFPILAVSDNLFIPKKLWNTFSKRFDNLQASAKMEAQFQKHYSYTKGQTLDIKPQREWQTLTQPVFINASLQLVSLQAALGAQLDRYNAVAEDLRQTKVILSNYKNHWLIRSLVYVRKLISKLKR